MPRNTDDEEKSKSRANVKKEGNIKIKALKSIQEEPLGAGRRQVYKKLKLKTLLNTESHKTFSGTPKERYVYRRNIHQIDKRIIQTMVEQWAFICE